MKTLWRILPSRAVVPVVAVETKPYGNSIVSAWGVKKNGDEFVGFINQYDAVNHAQNLIDKSELQAKSQLLNVERHRLHLEKSIRDYQQ